MSEPSKGTPPREKRTLVEEGTEFKGTMSSTCPIVVMGKVEGDVSGPSIHVTPSGTVAGMVKVKELRSEGELAGEVDADIVELSGRVRDNTVIRAATLEVRLHQAHGKMEVVFGQCELAIGDAPSKEAAIAAALAPPAPPPPPVQVPDKPAEARPDTEPVAPPVAAAEPAAAEPAAAAAAPARAGTETEAEWEVAAKAEEAAAATAEAGADDEAARAARRPGQERRDRRTQPPA